MTNASPVSPAFDLQHYVPSIAQPQAQHVAPTSSIAQPPPRSIRDIELQHVDPQSTQASVRGRSAAPYMDISGRA